MKLAIETIRMAVIGMKYLLHDDEGRPFIAVLVNNFPDLLFEVIDPLEAAVEQGSKLKRHCQDRLLCLPEDYTTKKRLGDVSRDEYFLYKGMLMQRVRGFLGSKMHLLRLDDGKMQIYSSVPPEEVVHVLDLGRVELIIDY